MKKIKPLSKRLTYESKWRFKDAPPPKNNQFSPGDRLKKKLPIPCLDLREGRGHLNRNFVKLVYIQNLKGYHRQNVYIVIITGTN